MSTELPELSHSDVRDWTEPRCYERGVRYSNADRIQSMRLEARTLVGECQGSRPNPYRLEVELDENGIARATCTCPVGGGGRCKHVVALLLEWIDSPHAYESVASLDNRLRRRSKDELVALVREMIDRYPSLQSLVALPTDETEPLDRERIGHFIDQAFENASASRRDYSYSTVVSQNLDPLLTRGYDQIEETNWSEVEQIFGEIALGICDRYGSVRDEHHRFPTLIGDCIDALGTLLRHALSADVRDATVRTLFDIAHWNAEQGGIGLGSDVAQTLDETTIEEERRLVVDWIEHVIFDSEAGKSSTGDESVADSPRSVRRDDWMREQLGALRLRMMKDYADADRYLEACHQTGHAHELVRALLDQDRVDDASEAVAEVPEYDLTGLLDDFVDTGANEAARKIARSRLEEEPSIRIARWLRTHALNHAEYELALYAARHAFSARPSVDSFEAVANVAEPLDQWTDLRPQLIEELREQSKYRALARVCAHIGDIDSAIDVVRSFVMDDDGWSSPHPVLEDVANAAEDERPDAAAELYGIVARDLIDERGRRNYEAAASLLTNVKDLYERKNRHDDWDAFITRLYEDELRSLPAAQDEFEKAGLL